MKQRGMTVNRRDDNQVIVFDKVAVSIVALMRAVPSRSLASECAVSWTEIGACWTATATAEDAKESLKQISPRKAHETNGL
jgi:hypothetical protein